MSARRCRRRWPVGSEMCVNEEAHPLRCRTPRAQVPTSLELFGVFVHVLARVPSDVGSPLPHPHTVAARAEACSVGVASWVQVVCRSCGGALEARAGSKGLGNPEASQRSCRCGDAKSGRGGAMQGRTRPRANTVHWMERSRPMHLHWKSAAETERAVQPGHGMLVPSRICAAPSSDEKLCWQAPRQVGGLAIGHGAPAVGMYRRSARCRWCVLRCHCRANAVVGPWPPQV